MNEAETRAECIDPNPNNFEQPKEIKLEKLMTAEDLIHFRPTYTHYCVFLG